MPREVCGGGVSPRLTGTQVDSHAETDAFSMIINPSIHRYRYSIYVFRLLAKHLHVAIWCTLVVPDAALHASRVPIVRAQSLSMRSECASGPAVYALLS